MQFPTSAGGRSLRSGVTLPNRVNSPRAHESGPRGEQGSERGCASRAAPPCPTDDGDAPPHDGVRGKAIWEPASLAVVSFGSCKASRNSLFTLALSMIF